MIPPKKEQLLVNQAKLILKGPGLSLIKPKFFKVDTETMGDEGSVFTPGGLDSYDKKSLFGTPIFDIVTIEKHSYTDPETGQAVANGEFDLELAIVEVTKPRNIVVTKIAGKNGTVKEFMSDDDYHITIRGSFVNSLAYSSPALLIRQFNKVTKSPLALSVNSNFLSYFEIFNIVIVDSKISQREGARNIVDYEIQALSDVPFEIRQENETRQTASL